jgi:hypothetical protein
MATFALRRGVKLALAAFIWLMHVAAAVAWYGAAIMSIAYWLS